MSAQRKAEFLALRLAPAVTAAGISFAHVESEWQSVLVLVCMVAVVSLLRSPHYPLHLIPFASAMLYLLAPPIGALVAVVISTTAGYPAPLSAGNMIAPVLGAWAVTGLGYFVANSFRRDRVVRLGVIGTHEFARGLAYELTAVGVRGYKVTGCIAPASGASAGSTDFPCLGTLETLRSAVLDNGIELLVLSPLRPVRSNGNGNGNGVHDTGMSRLDVFEAVADACLDLPVSMIEAGQLYEELLGHVPLGTTTSAWFQYLLHPRYSAGSPFSKRLLDLVLGAIAGVVAIVPLALGALAIKLTSRGPLLHKQVRFGEGGRPVTLVKLRTMHPDAESGGPRWSGDDDERVTPVGRVLRRLHVDELPQIWSVLKGEMSLVGPRPEQPKLVEDLERRFTYYDRRHLVKPGITGWAQVRCGYGGSHIGSAWKLCHDLYFLKRRSVLFDLLIMLETISTVIFPEPINRPDERFIVALRNEEDELGSLREIPAGVEAT